MSEVERQSILLADLLEMFEPSPIGYWHRQLGSVEHSGDTEEITHYRAWKRTMRVTGHLTS